MDETVELYESGFKFLLAEFSYIKRGWINKYTYNILYLEKKICSLKKCLKWMLT